MLLESALADFSQETTNVRGHPSAMPFVWDTKSGSSPFVRSSSYHERISMLSVQENEGLHLHEEAADMFNARKNHKGGHNRSDSGQFYHKEGTVPFKWEAAPGKPVVAQESITNPESPRLRPPPALRNVTIPVGCNSPRHGGIAGKVKSILSGKGPKIASTSSGSNSSNASSVISSKSSHVNDREQWSSSSGREDTDRESSIDSDGGEESSPVSTLDRPASPLSPVSPKPASSKQQELAVVPASTSTSAYRQPNYHGLLSRNGSWKHLAANASGRQHSHMAAPLLTMSEMSEELPMIEEDEEDSEFHTMEFSTVDSPGTIEERRERSLLRRPSSSKSMSAPLPLVRRQSSLGNASRQRRRSDFDWPEDYDERPEEVVKEVDESLWAFSPVASTFVFSGNENSGPSGRSPGRGGAVGTGSSTPSSSGSGSLRETGSIRETLSLRRTLMRSSSTRTGYNGKSSAEAAAAHAELSGQLGPNGRVKSRDDEELYHSSHGRMKRTLSCIPFLNLCRAHRPTPAISFSSRLSPNSATSRK